jgi:hypothetical protein
MEPDDIPKKVTQKYLASLTPEEKAQLLEIKKERIRLAGIEAKKLYQRRHREKVNEYQRERRRKIKEERILEEARRIQAERDEA